MRTVSGKTAALKALEFLTLVLFALSLVAAGAHLFELPNKIGLPEATYFIVQHIYRGWALFGIVLLSNLVVTLVLAIMRRKERVPFWLALASFLAVVASLAIFFAWTYPANQVTENWTVVPGDWEALRRQWEYSHAANAVVTFAGFCCAALAALTAQE